MGKVGMKLNKSNKFNDETLEADYQKYLSRKAREKQPAKEALEAAGIKGCVFEPVEVSE